MKKIFTLIAVALATMSVNAQTETYTAITRDAETKVMTLSDEFKAVLPLNEDGSYGDVATNKTEKGSVVTMKTASVTCVATGGSTPADVPDDPTDADGDGKADNTEDTHCDINEDGTVNSWNEIKWQQKNQGDINWAWIQGTGNPAAEIKAETVMQDDIPATYFYNGQEYTKYRPAYTFYNPDGSLGVPEMGLHYQFTASTAGTIKIGVWVNKGNRDTYVVDAATALPVAYKAEGYINGQNHKILPEGATDSVSVKKYLSSEEIDSIHKAAKVNAETGEDSAPYVIGAGNQPFFGYITFEMEAGKTYYVFCASTQLGFNGWEFTATGSAGEGSGSGETPAADAIVATLSNSTAVADASVEGSWTFANDFFLSNGSNKKLSSAGDYLKCSRNVEFTIETPASVTATAIEFVGYTNGPWADGSYSFIGQFDGKEINAKTDDKTTEFMKNRMATYGFPGNDEKDDEGNQKTATHKIAIENPAAGKAIKFQAWGSSQICIIINVYAADATGIESVTTYKLHDGAVYNLAGQKVGNDYKGIVIKNGKKYLNK